MHEKTTSKVRVNNNLLRQFAIVKGVRQGSIIAPFLFNLAIDWIMQNALCQRMHGVSLDDTHVPDVEFADDICLLQNNAEDAQHLLDSVGHAAKHVGLEINASKTKFCYTDPNITITCSGEQVERVEKFTYLGSSIQLIGDITGESKLRCAMSFGAMKKLVKFWRSRDLSTTIKSNFITLPSGTPYCIAVNRGHSRRLIFEIWTALKSDAPDLFSAQVTLSSLLTSVEFLNSIAASPKPSRSAD